MKSIVRTALVLTVLFAPVLAFAQYPGGPNTQTVNTGYTFGFISQSGGFFGGGICTGYISCLAGTVIDVINGVLVPVLFAIAFIVFLYGVALKYIFSAGDAAKVSEGHKLILWGLIAFVIMISVWGLVNVVANTFGLQGAYAPPPPTSYPLQ